MVQDEKTIARTIYFLEDDYEYLKSVHNNLHEAIRIVIRLSKSNQNKPIIFQYIQFTTFGIITLGISSMLPVSSNYSIFFFVIGCCLIFFGILNLTNIAIKKIRRNKKNVMETQYSD